MKKLFNEHTAVGLLATLLVVVVMSCGGSQTIRKSIDKIDVSTPAKAIKHEANRSKDLADDLSKDFPEGAVTFHSIMESQDNIILHAGNIEKQQPKIDAKNKREGELEKALEKQKEETQKESDRADEAEANRTSVLMWILYVLTTLGILAMVAAPIMFFWGRVEMSKALAVGIGGILLTGICIFLIKYMVLVLWVIGILILLVILFGIYQTYLYTSRNKGFVEVVDSFDYTDKEVINNIQSKTTQALVAQTKVINRDKTVKAAKKVEALTKKIGEVS